MPDMKDALLAAWAATLARRESTAAVLDTRDAVERTFRDIEREAADFTDHLFNEFSPGEVIAIQIGNHPSWPALLIACLRRELVVLPLERTISEHEREVACDICHAAALIDGDECVCLTRR